MPKARLPLRLSKNGEPHLLVEARVIKNITASVEKIRQGPLCFKSVKKDLVPFGSRPALKIVGEHVDGEAVVFGLSIHMRFADAAPDVFSGGK